ncbi:uncharacterized protein Dmul_06760 [Desulfococcus multivorans]|uniref:Uncharacterized protein n=2 Tax=Desulfococcus multivorans TaxID=897 RepID=Q2N4Z1_DESML|nr:uncharacterized protein Dmul_06760 [Desulfococcus multivorans]CAJ13803.1 hypothetical protein dmi65 [Desulfococcus multivorans]
MGFDAHQIPISQLELDFRKIQHLDHDPAAASFPTYQSGPEIMQAAFFNGLSIKNGSRRVRDDPSVSGR